MSDLIEACASAGLDSSKLRPIAHAMPDGRVAVYIGAAYQYLNLGKALNLRDQLTRAIDELRRDRDQSSNAPELFDVQIRQWRDGIRSCPPTPELGEARRIELEARAMSTLATEAQS